MKITKKILSCFLALLMTLSCFTVISVGASETTVSEAASVYDAGAAETLSDHVDNVYYIDSANEFMAFGNELSVNGNNFSGKTVKLNCDIVINQGDVSTWTNPVKWDGNGSSWDTRFAGSFDGQGHTISGIYNEGSNNAGLFGRIVGGTEFKNVTIVNSKFVSRGGTDGDGMGGLIGSVSPEAEADIKATTISNVHIDAILEAPQGCPGVGGIVGATDIDNSRYVNSFLIIENCSFSGTIEAKESQGVGGIVGYMRKGKNLVLENCSVDATINCGKRAGGLVGDLNSCNILISNCFAKGNITAHKTCTNNGTYYLTGSTIGFVNAWKDITVEVDNLLVAVKCNSPESLIATIGTATDDGPYTTDNGKYSVNFVLENIVYDKDVQEPYGLVRRDNQSAPGARVNNPYATPSKNTNSNLEEQISKESFNVTGKSSSELNGKKVLNFWTAVEGDYPAIPTTLAPDFYNGAPCSSYVRDEAKKTITIYTAEQLMGFAAWANEGFGGYTVKLAKDFIINTGDASDWATTAPKHKWSYSTASGTRFRGTFDGQGHTISGLYQSGTGYVGLFGLAGRGIEVKDVNIANSYFESTDSWAGSVIGKIDCWDSGTGKDTYILSNVYVDAIVKGTGGAAGLIGSSSENEGTSKVNITNCGFNGSVISNGMAGGFVGYGIATMNISKSTFKGSISGSEKVGGILGWIISSTNVVTIDKCIVDADISGQKFVGGLIGRVENAKAVVSDCLVKSDITTGEFATTAGVIGYYPNAKVTTEISNTLISVRGEDVSAAVLSHYSSGNKLTVKLDNVKYDSNRFNGNKMRDVYTAAGDYLVRDYTVTEEFVGMTTAELNGKAIFNGWTAVEGDYPVPTLGAIDSLKVFAFESYGNPTEILGYQTKVNSNEKYDVRLIATLTNELSATYVAAGFKDVKITLTNGEVKEIPTYYCNYAYKSVIGGGETYNASDYLTDSFFCLTIPDAPATVASIEATPFVMVSEDAEPVCGEAVDWTTGDVAPANLVTVMSLNVYLHDDADPDGIGPATAEDRLNAIQAQVLAQDPDVLCVQEDNWTTKLDALLTSKGYTAVRGKAISRSGWTGLTYESYEYQTIYYKTEKFTLETSGQKWLSDSPDEQYSDSYGTGDTRPRGINYAKLTSTSGETFYVFNVHLENADPTTRKQQAAKLVELVAKIAGEAPVIMCGDFNLISNTSDDNDKSAIASLKEVYDDTRIVADLTETHATFINAEGTIFGAEGTTATPTSGTIIDYCFTSKGDFDVYSYDVIAEKQNGIYTSDHLPLVIKLSIR